MSLAPRERDKNLHKSLRVLPLMDIASVAECPNYKGNSG